MRITSKGRYGLRAMMELAVSPGALVKTREIAERQGVPLKYLEQIVSLLRKGHLVQSVRGAEGGYRLARDSKEISVFEILCTLEGDLSIVDKSDRWEEGQGLFWSELDQAIQHLLDIPLSDFLARKSAEGPGQSNMYYI